MSQLASHEDVRLLLGLVKIIVQTKIRKLAKCINLIKQCKKQNIYISKDLQSHHVFGTKL